MAQGSPCKLERTKGISPLNPPTPPPHMFSEGMTSSFCTKGAGAGVNMGVCGVNVCVCARARRAQHAAPGLSVPDLPSVPQLILLSGSSRWNQNCSLQGFFSLFNFLQTPSYFIFRVRKRIHTHTHARVHTASPASVFPPLSFLPFRSLLCQ